LILLIKGLVFSDFPKLHPPKTKANATYTRYCVKFKKEKPGPFTGPAGVRIRCGRKHTGAWKGANV